MKVVVAYTIDDGGNDDDLVELTGQKSFHRFDTDQGALDAIQKVVDWWEVETELTIDQGGDDEDYNLDFADSFEARDSSIASELALYLVHLVEKALTEAGIEEDGCPTGTELKTLKP